MRTGFHFAFVKDADLQAAAAQVHDGARRGFGAESGEDRFAAETRFFGGVDDFQGYAGFLFDAANESIAIASFARGAGSYGAVFGNAKFVHGFTEVSEGFDGFFEEFFTKAMANENAFAEPK